MVYVEFKVRKDYTKQIIVKEVNTPNLVLNGKLCTNLDCICKLIIKKIKTYRRSD